MLAIIKILPDPIPTLPVGEGNTLTFFRRYQ